MPVALRRTLRWSIQHGFTLLFAFLAVGYATTFLKPRPAQADEAVDRLQKVALSDVGYEEKYMALEALKVKGTSAARAALVAIAEKGDFRIAMAACAQLGRIQNADAKADLKGLLEDADLRMEVRMGAAACIAEHWKDDGDISYLEGKCEGDSRLNAHLDQIKSRVYGR